MKKIVRIACIGLVGIALFAFSAADDSSFEGVITYSMSFGSGSSSPQAAAMMQGSNTKIYIKGDKTRIEVNTGMYKQVVIGDRKTKEEITLVEMMGNKYEIKSSADTKKDDANLDIKYIDSTKTIAGYTCKAAVVTTKNPKTGETYNTTVFYTDQLPYSTDMGRFKGLKGFPLQYGVKQQGMDISIAAQSVEKKPLSDTLFVVPAKGYKLENSREDMMKDIQRDMSGGGGQ